MLFDCVGRQAQAAMPAGCGVQLSYHANGELSQWSIGTGCCRFTVSTLLHEVDMVLMICWQDELKRMLKTLDDI